jgi:acyl dehydratase
VGEEALPAGAKISVTYRHPVRPGDVVSFEAGELEREEASSRLDGQCVNQDGTPVASLSITLPDAGS